MPNDNESVAEKPVLRVVLLLHQRCATTWYGLGEILKNSFFFFWNAYVTFFKKPLMQFLIMFLIAFYLSFNLI